MAMFGGNGTAGGIGGMAARGDALMSRAEVVLDLILEALDTRIEQVAVSDQTVEPGMQKDFPTPGSQRWMLNRTPDGREFEATAEVQEALPANVNRLGGTIVNMGSKPVKVLMAKPSQVNSGTGFLYLMPEGGSWDFRLGHLFWSGTVSLVSVGGNTNVALIEV